MNSRITCNAVIFVLLLCYNAMALAIEEKRAYFHFRKKSDNSFPFEIYMNYKPEQLVNNKGIELNLVYVNKANEAHKLALDEDYCKIYMWDNGKMIDFPKNRGSKGLVKFMSQGIFPEDGKLIKKSESKILSINIDKINKENMKVMFDAPPSKYGIQLSCVGVAFTIERPKMETFLFSIETDIFYINYKK
ncbi:MAG: hypothetical protein PHU14_11300 [Methylovulum sp.]|nr:hypothetical protein [Methylovulum sp.]